MQIPLFICSTFLQDSAASTHMGYSDKGMMFDLTAISSPVKIGNSGILMLTKIGKRHVTAMQVDSIRVDLIL
jgi:hypothetical protein